MAEEGVEFTGKTVGDAITQAEQQLGLGRSDLRIDVLSPGRSGLFGIGAEPAHIRVWHKQMEAAPVTEPEPVAVAAPAPEAAGALAPRPEEEAAVEAVRPSPAAAAETAGDEEAEADSAAPAVDTGDLPAEAQRVLSGLLESMGFEAEVSVRSRQDPIMLVITGTNLGVLIGRRGENLSALQFMLNLILSKHRRQWPRVVIDVENYRARREEALRSLADRIAYRVRRSQRPYTLEAMPAGDRRIIHLTLRDDNEIETYSIGEGVARRVVIAPRRRDPAARPSSY